MLIEEDVVTLIFGLNNLLFSLEAVLKVTYHKVVLPLRLNKMYQLAVCGIIVAKVTRCAWWSHKT